MLLPIDPSWDGMALDLLYRRVPLTNLFGSISSGLAVTQKTPRRVRRDSALESVEYAVVFLRHQSFLPAHLGGGIDWNVIHDDLNEKPKGAGVTGNLSEDEVLREDDYLLTMRGMPRGFSCGRMGDMPQELRESKVLLAAGNNFIRLRPNPEADCEPAFLHFLLDMLVAKLLNEYENLQISPSSLEFLEGRNEPKEGESGVSSSRLQGSFIRVSDLKAMSVNIPYRREDRSRLFSEYNELLQAERRATENLKNFRRGFIQSVIPLKYNTLP